MISVSVRVKKNFRKQWVMLNYATLNIYIVIVPLASEDGVENIVGQGENAGYQHFLFPPQCLRKIFFSRS